MFLRICKTAKVTKIVCDICQRVSSPGVKECSVEQRAVEVVASKVGAHDGAAAVFGGGDGFGDHHVSVVPQVQQMKVKHQGGIWRYHITYKEKRSYSIQDANVRKV